jgi:hypothetical protein
MHLEVVIENHFTRNCAAFVKQIEAEGITPIVSTDRSDYIYEKGHERMHGQWDNYVAMMKIGLASKADWIVFMQDDVSVPAGLFGKMAHILPNMPGPLVSFYVPQNGLYTRAVAENRHVVETYQNFWIQTIALKRSDLPKLYAWGMAHIQPAWDKRGDGNGDDDFLNLYCSHERVPCHVVLPSLVQHLGAGDSLFGTSGSVGRYPRVSACYDPNFDPRTVDWPKAFANRLVDKSRISKSDVRWKRAWGLA